MNPSNKNQSPQKIVLVQIYGSGSYAFNGYNNVIIRVEKETKTHFIGYVTNLLGNYDRLEDYNGMDGKKMVINKNGVQAWRFLE
jgi:hypothetical protein